MERLNLNLYTKPYTIMKGVVVLVLDVVCKMDVNEKTAKWKSEYKGKTYYFCAPMCKQKFDRNPEKYVK